MNTYVDTKKYSLKPKLPLNQFFTEDAAMHNVKKAKAELPQEGILFQRRI